MSRPVLILTNSRDYATDAVVKTLRAREVDYVRLDLDLLHNDEVVLHPTGPVLEYAMSSGPRRTISSPLAVFYRAPTHLRESSGHRHTPEELLRNHQWAAFARSLAVFTEAKWVNHPVATYAAENKPHQLSAAAAVGFRVPQTAVGNSISDAFSSHAMIAIKALDSFLLRQDEEDLFFYTTFVAPGDVAAGNIRGMPIIVQQPIAPKTDVRITVIGDACFAAKLESDVSGDWRLQKDQIRFRPFDCPPYVLDMCVTLTKRLGLRYGAIDLARSEDSFWFFEINPTGEWGWLDDVFGGAISVAIAEELCRE